MKSSNIYCMLQDRLKLAMEEANMSAYKLAKAVNVSHVAVGQWLNGASKNIKGATAIKVAESLHVNLNWLLNGVGPMHGVNVIAVEKDQLFNNQDYVIMPLHQLRCEQMENDYMGKYDTVDPDDVAIFTKEFFSKIKVDPKDCIRCKVLKDNMAPTLKKGDVVVINTKDEGLKSDQLYAFSNKGELELYKVYVLLNGELSLRSDNNNYPNFSTSLQQLHNNNIFLLGRVILGTVFFLS